MAKFNKIPIFLLVQLLIIVNCKIPSLNVRKLDQNVIDRKRQDTMEMCRIFNAASPSEKYQLKGKNLEISPDSYVKVQDIHPRRVKRAALIGSPLYDNGLSAREARRVENIVDQLYDEAGDENNPVTYRQKRIDIQSSTTAKVAYRELKTVCRNVDATTALHLFTTPQCIQCLRRLLCLAYAHGGAREGIRSQALNILGHRESVHIRRRFDVAKNCFKLAVSHKAKINRQLSGRRHDFAPHWLLGPHDNGSSSSSDSDNDPDRGVPVPWRKKWPKGIVPYFIDPKTYDNDLGDSIVKAFDYFEKATCIRLQRLREKPVDKASLENVEWVYITNPAGIRQCVHSNDMKPNTGVQVIVLGYDCISIGQIVHEVMHILGFSHEHNRPDRDEYVTINWDNIKPGYKKYFELGQSDFLMNLPYDYASILHYPSRAFTKNGEITIFGGNGINFGQRKGLSEIDIEKISLVFGYDCVERNRQYLISTCPTVVRSKDEDTVKVTKHEIDAYFKDRLWPYGIVNYKIRDRIAFSVEELDNIQAVIRHIQETTCIQFSDVDEEEKKLKDESHSAEHSDNTSGEVAAKPSSSTSDRPRVSPSGSPSGEVTTEPSGHSSNEETAEPSDNPSGADTISKEKTLTGSEEGKEKKKSGRSGIIDNVLTDSDILEPKVGSGRSGQIHTRFGRSLFSGNREKSYRRHADNVITFTRSAEPGCACPAPGRPHGSKVLVINSDCFNSVNDLLHVFVHILGLDHQHNMFDRDSYIYINWSNLTQEMVADMKNKLPPPASVGFPYDYHSVMHYPWLQIKDGATNVIYPIWNDGWAMGHWQGLSYTDVRKINTIYHEQCNKKKSLMKTKK